MEFDMDFITGKGYSCVTPVIITNMDDIKSLTPIRDRRYRERLWLWITKSKGLEMTGRKAAEVSQIPQSFLSFCRACRGGFFSFVLTTHVGYGKLDMIISVSKSA